MRDIVVGLKLDKSSQALERALERLEACKDAAGSVINAITNLQARARVCACVLLPCVCHVGYNQPACCTHKLQHQTSRLKANTLGPGALLPMCTALFSHLPPLPPLTVLWLLAIILCWPCCAACVAAGQ